jgi:hypothetical protein
MYDAVKHEGIFFNYKSEDDLLFKEIYSGKLEDTQYVKLFHKGLFVGRPFVWRDGDMDGREYIEINHCVVYLDTLKTLPEIDECVNHICKMYEVTMTELKSESRKVRLTEPRNILYFILRNHYSMTYQAIADKFHKLSHATVKSGEKRIKGFMEFDKRYRAKIESLILTKAHEPACLDNIEA